MSFPFLSGAKWPFPWKITREVIEHSFTPVVGHKFSTKEFYDAIQQVIEKQEVPGLAVSEFSISEGGPLADKRLYLRVKREKLSFDICAAPMGTNFFFSYRFIEQLPVITIWDVLILSGGLGLLAWMSVKAIGPFLGPLVLLGLVTTALT